MNNTELGRLLSVNGSIRLAQSNDRHTNVSVLHALRARLSAAALDGSTLNQPVNVENAKRMRALVGGMSTWRSS